MVSDEFMDEIIESEIEDMTTSKPTDIREFWIYIGDYEKGEFDAVGASPLFETPEQIHVIEYAAYEQLKAECEQLKTERDLAIAHDTQPYPTAFAYEQVCKTNNDKADEITKLREQVKDYEQALEFDCGNRCAEQSPCNSKEVLNKWSGV